MSTKIGALCAVVAVATSLGAIGYSLEPAGGAVSGLVDMSADEPLASLARQHDPSFVFVDPEAHYDGVYFYAMALDPLARGQAHRLIDKGPARYSHPGFSWLVAVVTLGNERAVPIGLLLVGLVGMAVAAYALSALATDMGASAWWGLAAAMSPGLVYSAASLTSEPVGVAVLIVSLLWWHRGHRVRAAPLLVLLCFLKEPYLLVVASIGAWELITWARARDGRRLLHSLLLLAPGPLLTLIWWTYITRVYDESPTEAAEGLLNVPPTGWTATLRIAAEAATGPFFQMQTGAAALPLLICIAGILLVGLVAARNMRTVVDTAFVMLAAVAFTLGPLALLYVKDAIRSLAAVFVLLPIVLITKITVSRSPAP